MPATSGPLPGTGVTPSAAKTCALSTSGVASHMPPVAPSGSTSRMVVFQASLGPVFWTSIAKMPHCPTFIVAGPDFVTSSTGGTNVNCPSRSAVLTRASFSRNELDTGLPSSSRKLIDNV